VCARSLKTTVLAAVVGGMFDPKAADNLAREDQVSLRVEVLVPRPRRLGTQSSKPAVSRVLRVRA
jgi:hypothetical protein